VFFLSKVNHWLTIYKLFLAIFLCGVTQVANATNAYVADSVNDIDMKSGAFFVVESFNDTKVDETALSASRRASFGKGMYMTVKQAGRNVPAGEVVLKFRGIRAQAAPIDTIFKSIFQGGNPEVSGTVTVQLVAGQRYKVNGVLDAYRREIWVEDQNGAQLPNSKVVLPPDTELLKQMEGAVFTATNLRYDGDWINETSLPHQSFVPVGSRIKVLSYSTNSATVLIDGRKMRMGVDYTRKLETIQQLFSRSTSDQDPREKVSTYAEKVRSAINSARVFTGMTKEQELLAMGRPRIDYVPSLDSLDWRYDILDYEELFLVFDENGVLKDVEGSRRAKKFVMFEAP
jgi:hypothetical protein